MKNDENIDVLSQDVLEAQGSENPSAILLFTYDLLYELFTDGEIDFDDNEVLRSHGM